MPGWIQEKQTTKQSERSKPAKKQQREQERKSQLQKIAMVSGCRRILMKSTPELKIKTKGWPMPPMPPLSIQADRSEGQTASARDHSLLHTSVNSNLARICTNMHKYKLKKNADESHISSSTWPRSITKPCACRWTLHDLYGPGT